MVWRDEYCIGVEKIDKQHKGLFTMTARLVRILAEQDFERNRRACIEAIKYLKSYALTHFADEEAYQISIGYIRYEQHKRQHEDFVKNLLVMEQDMTEQGFSRDSIRVFVGALSAWLLHHIMCSDQDIVGNAHVINPENNLDPAVVLRQVVQEECRSIFGKEPTLTDGRFQGELPGGERFIVADCETSGGRRLRILAALSLHFSLHLTNTLLDIIVQDTDLLARSTVENLFSLMIQRFTESLFDGEECHARVSTVRRSELLPIIPQDAPMCSLLFDSDFGPFAMRAWDMP